MEIGELDGNMSGATSKRHKIDFFNPVEHVKYLGDPADEVIAIIEADGWTVDLYDDSPIDYTNYRSHIRTLEVRYDEVPIAVRNGRVIAIGSSAPFCR